MEQPLESVLCVLWCLFYSLWPWLCRLNHIATLRLTLGTKHHCIFSVPVGLVDDIWYRDNQILPLSFDEVIWSPEIFYKHPPKVIFSSCEAL